MSKIIETLKINPSKENTLHQQIADTYFYKKPRTYHKKKAKHQKNRIKSLSVGAISFAGASLVIFLIFSFLNVHYLDYLKKKIDLSPVVAVFDTGKLNKELIKKFEFRGTAKGKSKIIDKALALYSPKKYKWADMSMDFRFPVDFSDRVISFSVKGKRGGEKVGLVLRDADNRSSALHDIFLTTSWRTETMPLDGVKKDIDLSRISHFRVECSYLGEPPKDIGASPADVNIYIKDIKFSKKGIGA